MEQTEAGRQDATQSLQEFLEPRFAELQRKRGTELWLDGAVDVHRGDDLRVEARVRASTPRDVALWFEDGDLRFTCGCEDSAESRPCEHLFAVVREIGLLGLLRGVRRHASVRLRATLRASTAAPPPSLAPGHEQASSDWQSRLAAVSAEMSPGEGVRGTLPVNAWPRSRQLLYLVDIDASRSDGSLVLRLARRDRRADGTFGRPRIADLSAAEQEGLSEANDRQVFDALRGVVSRGSGAKAVFGAFGAFHNPLVLPPALQRSVGPLMCATGRCYALEEGRDLERSLRFEDLAWRLRLRVSRVEDGGFLLRGELFRGADRLDVAEPLLLTDALLLRDRRLAPIADEGGREWMTALRRAGPIQVPAAEGPALVERLMAMPRLPPMLLPPELKVEESRPKPRPMLRLEDPPDRQLVEAPLVAEVSFDYEGWVVPAGSGEQRRFVPESRRLLVRDDVVEREALDLLAEFGVGEDFDAEEPVFELKKDAMMRVVRGLLERGWAVEVFGRIVRPPVRMAARVRTEVDWFELFGTVEYGDATASASLPDVLKAVRMNRELIPLGDGSFGLVPPEWQRRYGLLPGLGVPVEGGLRFERRRVAVLDAVLADELDVSFDQAYQRARDRLRRFSGVTPADPPPTFRGSLRPYQREALGWFRFLADFGFGGCLADDMGLGKTVQVLALLETRRAMGAANGVPSLVVAPRSLLFNWAREARQFAPELTVLEHTGKDRPRDPAQIRADVVLTTYGVLVRDQDLLAGIEFDYVVLDEAQTIKNRGTRTSKAALALRGRQRLALTGTPLENHVGELFNLFEFLNPGLLGSLALQRKVGLCNNPPDEEDLATMRRLLRPFMLRRTKREVAKDLPQKTEQVLSIDLSEDERLAYDEIRAYYRGSLLERIQRDGMQKSRMHVLEGLLRLRQAACHIGMLDGERANTRGAKLEVLLSKLQELLREGHKAVVFSQFTRFLAIIRDHLDQEGIAYAYLDGQTADRQAEVVRFQEDPKVGVFLISIKAGGVGLNLTAADYVFLLDPWWNPAVEAQAIDRAYRIGQTRPVFAYRLIARDTIEERVAALQQDKRDLSDSLLDAREQDVERLSRADLESLLS